MTNKLFSAYVCAIGLRNENKKGKFHFLYLATTLTQAMNGVGLMYAAQAESGLANWTNANFELNLRNLGT